MCPLLFVYFCVLCLKVVPLSPGKIAFAVQLNNNNNNNNVAFGQGGPNETLVVATPSGSLMFTAATHVISAHDDGQECPTQCDLRAWMM
jgi:hypothetical protein